MAQAYWLTIGGRWEVSEFLHMRGEKKVSLGLSIDRFVDLEPGHRARLYLKASMVSVQLEIRSSAQKEGGGS